MEHIDFFEFSNGDFSEEREKRIKKAASAECTPLKIIPDEQRGIFGGSGGTYNTSISECDCKDFRIRRFPCKHMYRLAHELKIYDLGSVSADVQKIKRPAKERRDAYNSVIALIDKYPEKVQKALQSLLSDRYKDIPTICEDASIFEQPFSDGLLEIVDDPVAIIKSFTQKRTVEGILATGFVFPDGVRNTKKARYEWCLLHPDTACAYVYPSFCVIRPAGPMELVFRRIYTYLNKKYGRKEIMWR